MMLPITIPSDIFKRYENLIKHFLWGDKKARIKFEKLYAPREKGGLGLPNPKFYFFSFEVTKLAKYWERNETEQEWLNIETNICAQFNPKDKLYQRIETTNTVFIYY